MASDRYVKGVVIWLIVLLSLMLAFCLAVVVLKWVLTSILLFCLLILTTVHLFKKINTTNRRLAGFFRQINSGESAIHYPESGNGLGFDEINAELNRLAHIIYELQHSRRQEADLFQALVKLMPVGLFLLTDDEHLFLANPAGRDFLNVRSSADHSQLQARAPYFYKALPALRRKNKIEIDVKSQGETQKWQIKRTLIHQNDQRLEVFMTMNLQAAMESNEARVSELLMHTLTHEIMNSISPITSLVDTLQLQLHGLDHEEGKVMIPTEEFQDIQTSASVIQRRSRGLVEFVERFALLARLPRLSIERINGQELLRDIEVLMKEELKKQGVALESEISHSNISFRADKQLLLQVIINLIKNATEAYQGKGKGVIKLSFAKGDGYNYISVSDEAGGIPPDIQNEIFLPFFTTKNKGSGIGLSLSRKIIQAHQGRLYLKSHPRGSEFRIELAD